MVQWRVLGQSWRLNDGPMLCGCEWYWCDALWPSQVEAPVLMTTLEQLLELLGGTERCELPVQRHCEYSEYPM